MGSLAAGPRPPRLPGSLGQTLEEGLGDPPSRPPQRRAARGHDGGRSGRTNPRSHIRDAETGLRDPQIHSHYL